MVIDVRSQSLSDSQHPDVIDDLYENRGWWSTFKIWFRMGKAHTPGNRRRFYIRYFLYASSAIWLAMAVLLSLLPERYMSEWTLIIPGTGEGHAVSLESIGQATAKNTSPFSHSSIDPRVNYKSISTSKSVIQTAAKSVSMTSDEFGKPKVKLTDQTALMEFKIYGSSPEQVKQKADALYQSFQSHLEALRQDEQNRINESHLNAIESFSKKLEQAQKNKADFQSRSTIFSIEQFNQLVMQLENKRSAITETSTQHQAISEKIVSLQQSLNLSDQQIIYAVKLRNDKLFQEYLSRHADIHTQISTIRSSWGTNHPKLKQLRAAHHAVNEDIRQRGEKLIHDHSIALNKLIEIGSSQFESAILGELIRLKSEQSSLASEIESLTEVSEQLSQRIESSTNDAVKVEDLIRKQQVATAVFTTALAKHDIGKADHFASYPLVQLFTPPNMPESADTLPIKLAIVGAFFTNLFLGLGLLLLWYRKPLLRRIQLKS